MKVIDHLNKATEPLISFELIPPKRGGDIKSVLSVLDEIIKYHPPFIDIGPYEVGGDGTTIFNTEYSFSESIEMYPVFRHDVFENDLGPSMRFIYDFSKPYEFFLILTTGQSGNVMSDHYADMSLMWLTGKYMKISTDKIQIKKAPNKLLVLTP